MDLTVRLVDDAGTPTLQLVDNTAAGPDAAVVASRALADTSSVQIQGSNQDDRVTIDASVPTALPVSFAGGAGSDTLIGPQADSTWQITGANAGSVGGVTFTDVENLTGAPNKQDTFVFQPGASLSGVVDGGAGGFDSLVVNGTFNTIVFTPSGPNSGTVARDGDVITYAGLEPVLTPGGTAANVIFNLPAGDNQAFLEDDGTPGNGVSQLRSGNGSFETTTFSNPTAGGSLTINLGSGGDSITLNALDSTFDVDLNIVGGAGDDDIIFGAKTGTHTYTINGGGGTDAIEATADASFTLTDTQLTIGSTSLTLSSVEQAKLTNSGSAGHTLDASAFTLGSVTLTGGGGNDTLKGGSGDDSLVGGSGNDSLVGGGGNDTLSGGANNDTLVGGGGDDSLLGGTGNDRYVFANSFGTDTLTENAGEGTDTLDFTAVTNEISVNGARTVFTTSGGSLTQSNPELAEEIDVTLLSGVKTQINGVLTELSNLIDKAQTDANAVSELINALPFLGTLTGGGVPNLADLLGLTQTFKDLKDAVSTAITGLSATPKLSDVVNALNGMTKPTLFTGGGNHVTFSTDYRGKAGSPDAGQLEALIDMDFHGSASDTVPIETGADAKGAGIDLHANVSASATLSGVLTLGIDTFGTPDTFLVPSTAPIRLDVSASASLGGSSVNLGILALSVSSGSISFHSHVDLMLKDPNTEAGTDGRITAAEVTGGSPNDFLDVTTGDTIAPSATLTVGVDSGVKVGVDDLSTATVTVMVTFPGGVFGTLSGPSAPHFSFTAMLNGNPISLDDFGNVSTTDLLGMLGQVLNAMSGLGKSAVLSTAIPFTGKTVGDIVDLASSFKARFLDPLFKSGDILNPDFNGDGATDFNDLYFSSIQGLAKAITAELGLGSLLDINFDSLTKELTFSVDFKRSVGDAKVVQTQQGNGPSDPGTDQNEVQTLTVNAVASGGLRADTFKLGFSSGAGLIDYTAPIDFDATAAQIQSALVALAGIAPGDVVVAQPDLTKPVFTITFQGALANKNIPALIVDATELALGLPLNFGASLGDIAGVTTKGTLIMAADLSAGLTFGVDLGLGAENATKIEITPPVFQPDNSGQVVIETTAQGSASHNETQKIHVNNATSGTFLLNFDGNGNSDPIAFNASATALKNALTVAGTGLTGTQIDVSLAIDGNDRIYTVEFIGTKAITNVAQLVAITSDNNGPTLKGPAENGIISGTATTATFDAKVFYNPAVAVVTKQQGDASHDEQQQITLLNTTGGTFTLTFNGQVTDPINAATATGADVAAALDLLSTINTGGGSVSGSGAAGGPYTITFGGGPLHFTNVAQLTANGLKLVNGSTTAAISLTGLTVNKSVTTNNTSMGIDTEHPLTDTSLQADVQKVINDALIAALKSLGFFTADLIVGGSPFVAGSLPMATPLPNDLAFTLRVARAKLVETTNGGGGQNEVQTLSINPHTTGGTYRLSFGGDTTDDIAFNATAATVQTALTGLASIGANNVAVALAGTTYTITFQNGKGNLNVAPIGVDDSLLTPNINGSLRQTAVTNAASVPTALAAAINAALNLAGVPASEMTVTGGLDGSNHITLSAAGSASGFGLLIQMRSPITVDAGGGRIALSASPITVSVDALSKATNVDGRLQVTTDFNDRGYQELGLLSAPTRFDGVTGDPISFTLLVNNTPVPVTLGTGATSGNTSIDDLISDLQGAVNTGLTGAGKSAGDVIVFRVDADLDPTGNRIGFRGKDGVVSSLSMNVPAGATNGTITDLGYLAGQGETHKAKADLFFLQDVSLTGNFALAASNVEADATLGFLGIKATGEGTLGSNKFVDASVNLALKNPVDGTNRVTVGEIGAALKAGNFFFHDADKGGTEDAPTTGVVDATVSGGVGFHLAVVPITPVGGISALTASLDLTAFSPNWLTAIPSFADPLGFGTDSHDISAGLVTLDTAVPGNGRLTDSVTFVVSDGTHTGIVFLPSKDTSTFNNQTDLENALQTAVNAAMAAGTVSGTVTVGLSGGKITLSGSGATLTARGPIAFSGPDVNAILDKFRDLSFDDIIAGLKFVINFLRSLDGSGGAGGAVASALDFKIPLIDKSVADLVDIAGTFADKLNAITNNPSGAIQELNKFIDGLLGLSPSTNILSFDPAEGVLGIDFSVGESVHLGRPFDLDLADAGLPSFFTNLVSLSASGNLDVSASVEFDLKLGLDLTGPDKSFFIQTGPTGTGLHADLTASGNALNFNAQLGPFGLFVIGGSASLNGHVDVTMVDDGDGRFDLVTLTGVNPTVHLPFLSDLDTDPTHMFPTAGGKNSASVNLPLFIGTADSPIPLDFASALHGGLEHGQHNALGVNVNLVNLFTSQPNAFSFTLPEFDFGNFQIPGIFALLSDPAVTVDGLDRLLQTIQTALNGEILGVKLPLIGDALANNPVANFIGNLRSDVLQPLARTIRENNLNLDGLLGVIQQTLFDVFSTKLGILKDITGDSSITKDDVEFTFLDDSGNVAPELFATALQLQMDLGKTFTFATDPIDLDLGIPALGIHAQLQPKVSISFDLQLGFGVDEHRGFYFVTDQNGSAGGNGPPELAVTVYADLGSHTFTLAHDDTDFTNVNRAQLNAQLLFLALKIADGVDLNGDGTISLGHINADGIPDDGDGSPGQRNEFTHIKLTGSIDIADPNDDGKLTIPEMVGGSFKDIVRPSLDGEASLHAQAKVDFSTLGASLGNVLPSVTADLLVDFGLHADPGTGFEIAPPQVILANVTLDLGSFISSFAGPILKQIHDILAPFDWLIGPDGFLNKRIPLLSDLAGHTITGKDLIVFFDPDDGPAVVAILNFVQELEFLSGLVADAGADAASGHVGLNFGDLILFDSPDISNFGGIFSDHPLSLGGVGGDLRSLGSFKNVSLPSANDLQNALTTPAMGSKTSSFTSGVTESGSIDFAILKPENIFKLILGQPDVTLVTVQLPKMQFNFLYRQMFPIIGPIVGTFAGGVGGGLDIGFGLDTRGFTEFVQTHNPADLLDSFFINDLDPKTGADKPEAFLTAQIAVGAALSLGIASAGVEGGIQATIDFNLADLDHDGKIRLNELAANVLANGGNPLAIFDVSGEVDFFLRAFIEFLFVKLEFEFARIKLFEFDISFQRPPQMGTLNGDTLTLNLGPNAAGRLNGDVTDGNENLVVGMDGSDVVISSFSVNGHSETIPDIKGFGRFSGVHKIIVDGGAGKDNLDLSGVSSSIAIEAHGGVGDDTITGGAGADSIFGDAGNDHLLGGGGNDTISGGDGNDTIEGGAGDNVLQGDAGDDSLIGGTGNDTFTGGAGNDHMVGGGGTNVYQLADFGSIETIDASGGSDTLDFSTKPQGLTFFLVDPGSGLQIQVGMTQTVTHSPAADPLDPTGPQVAADPVLADFADRLTVTNVDGVKKIIGSDFSDTFFVHQTRAAGQIELDGGKGSDRYVFAVGSAHIDALVNDIGNPWDSSNTIEVRGTSGADTITVTNDHIALAVGETVQYVPPAADANVLQVKVLGKGGDDTLNVESTAETVPVRVEGGGGNDLVTVGGSGTVNDITGLARTGLNSPFGLGPLVLVGGAGQDSVVVDDSSDTTPGVGNLTAFSETRLGFTDPVEVGVVSGLGMTLHADVTVETTTEGDGSHNEVQQIHVNNAISGTYTLSFSGPSTAAIAFDASAADVKAKLQAVAGITTVNVSLSVSGSERVYTVEFANPGHTDVAQLVPDIANLFAGPGRAEFEGFEASDVKMGKGDDTFTVGGDAIIADLPQNRQPTVIHAVVSTTTPGVLGTTNEVQQVKILGGHFGHPGSFTLTDGSQTTDPIPFDAGATTVRDALVALSSIGKDALSEPNVDVSMTTSGQDDVYTITFQHDLGNQDVAHLVGLVASGNTITGMTLVEGGGGSDTINIIATNTLDRSTLNGNLALVGSATTTQGPSVTVETTIPGGGADHEVKKLHVTNATGGTFTLSNDDISGPIAYNASAATVQAALETLPGLSGHVSVTLDVIGSDRVYTIVYTGDTAPHQLTPDPSSIVGPNEVQTIAVSDAARDVGYFTISYRFEETAPIKFGASADEVRDALTALPLIGFDASNNPNVGVTKGPGTGTQVYTVEFSNGLQQQDVAQLIPLITPLLIRGDTGGLAAIPTTTTQGKPDPGGANEVQQITIERPGGLTGSFKLTFKSGDNSDTTGEINFGETAGNVQTALEGLSTIGAGNVTVGKAVVNGNDVYTVTFGGTLAKTDVGQLIPKIVQDGADTLNVQSIRETTFFLGGGGDDTVNLNVNVSDISLPAITTNGVNALVTLDGQGGSDTYNINLIGGITASLINVFDTGLGNDGSDHLNVFGTELPDLFLLRAAAAETGLAFIALLNHDGTKDADHQPFERVNYDINLESITVNSLGGDDQFYIDDTRATITINAGDGNDFFQIGQLYQTRRTTEEAGVAEGDVFATIETTKGWLSNGVSFPITINGDAGEDLFIVFHNLAVADLNGGADNDTFIVQAFALAGSTEDHRALTDLSGGAGADFIQYAVDAPVNINGGDGFDTVIVIGTEFGDDIVVTPHGVFGAGLNVNFINIELLQVDGAEGDDRFFILGTDPDIITEISGGLGTDLFSINGPTPANGVISNDLRGHSGILTHDVISNDLTYNGLKVVGISANVADNDEPAIIITQTDGSSMVVQGDTGGMTLLQANAAHLVDSYTIVLSRPPVNGSEVHIAIDPPPGLVFVDGTIPGSVNELRKADGTADGRTLTFTGSDWYKPHTVYFKVDSHIVDIPDVADLAHKVTAAIGGVTRAEITGSLAALGAGANNGSPVTVATTTPGNGGQNEVQTVTVAHTSGFGFFTLTFRDEETDPILFGASAADVQTALLALPLIGKDASNQPNVAVTGGPATYTITFQNGLGDQDVQQLKGREEATLIDPSLPSRVMPGAFPATDGLPEGLRGALVNITGSASHPEIVGQTRLILFGDNATHTLVVNKPWILPKGFSGLPKDTQYEIKLFSGLSVPDVRAQIFTNQRAELVVSQTEGSTSVAEISTNTSAAELNTELANRQVDEIDVRLSALPSGTVTVNLDGHGQLEFFDKDTLGAVSTTPLTSLTFTSGNFDQFRHILVRGIDDAVVEGFHKSDLTLTASGDGYANVKSTLTADIADNEFPGVRIMESNGSTDVIEFVAGPSPSNTLGDFGVAQATASSFGFPFNDTYQIELTKQPTSDVTIRVVSNPTRTSRTGGIRSFVEQLEVSTDGGATWSLNPTVTFSHTSGLATSWNVPQTIKVRALNDARVDGSDTQVFAPTLDQLNSIQGALIITGAQGPDHTGLLEREPIMLPGERNEKPSMGDVVAATEAGGGLPATIVIDPADISVGEIAQINGEVNASVHLPDGGLTDPSQLTNVSIQITHGPGKNKVRIITGGTAIDAHHWVLTLGHTWFSPFPTPGNADVPDATSKYVLLQTNPNLLVTEADQTDILQVHDTDNVNSYNDPAAPAPPPGSVDRNPFAAGRLFFDSQNLFGAKATVSTEVNGGPKVNGPTVSEVQQLVLTAISGTFTLIFEGQTTTPLAFNASAADIQSALEALSTIGVGKVAVTKDPIDPKYTITFQGALANIDVPRVHADSTNLIGGSPLNQFRITGLGMGGDGPSFQRTVGTGTDARSEPGGIAFQEFENLEIDLGPGNDHFTIDNTQAGVKTVLNTGAGKDLVDVKAISGHTFVNLGAGDDTINVHDDNHTLEPFQGLLTVSGDVPRADVITLAKGSPTQGSLIAAVNEIQQLTIDATGGTFTLSLDGQTTGNLAFNAPATGLGSVQAALEGLSTIGAGNVQVTNAGSVYRITFVNGKGAQDIDLLSANESGLTNGLGANDVMNVDDGGHTAPTVSVLTSSSLTGLSTTQVNEIQSLVVDATQGTFTVSFNGHTSGSLAYNISAADLQTALQTLPTIPIKAGDVAVTKNDDVYTIRFQGNLTSTDVAQLVAASINLQKQVEQSAGDPNALPSATTATAGDPQLVPGSVAVFTRVDGKPTLPVNYSDPTLTGSTINDEQVVTVKATGGTYTLTLLSGTLQQFTTLAIPFDASAEFVRQTIQNAAAAAIAPGDTFEPQKFDVTVDKYAFEPNGEHNTVYIIGFQGKLRQFNSGPGVDLLKVNAAGLTGPGATAAVTTRMDGINYYGIETLNIDTGSNNDMFNVQGTTAGSRGFYQGGTLNGTPFAPGVAVTNVRLHNGNEQVFVSSNADLDFASAPGFDFLTGNLDDVNGALNLDFGSGRHKLMISDEGTSVGDGPGGDGTPVVITDTVANVPGGAASRGLPVLQSGAEIWITGLAGLPGSYPEGGISYGADPATGNFFDGIEYWTGSGNDTITIDGTINRSGSGQRTMTLLNTGLGNDNVTVNLNGALNVGGSDTGQDGFFALSTMGGSFSPIPTDTVVTDNDTVNASGSTLPLVIFGGLGNDNITGGTNNDIIFGDDGRVQYFNPVSPSTLLAVVGFGGRGDLISSQVLFPTWVMSRDLTLGGQDTVRGNSGEDILIGGAAGDTIDGDTDSVMSVTDTVTGGSNDDLIFGDAVKISRRPTDITNPRFETLSGTTIYAQPPTNSAGADNADGTARNYRDPNGVFAPSWALYRIHNLYHTLDIQNGVAGSLGDLRLAGGTNILNSFGNDYIAGGAASDEIFGQLGNDTIQGDGSIVSGANASRNGSGDLVLVPSFERASDGDDYIEGGGGNDTVFGGLGQDDIIGGSSDLFTLNTPTRRPDGSDLIFGGAGTHAGRNDLGNLSLDGVGVSLNQLHARDADTIIGDNGDIFRLVGVSHTDPGGFLTFNYDATNAFEDRGTLRLIPRASRLLDYTPGGPDFNAAGAATDIGGADEVHGEGGDDVVYTGLGNDVLFGDGQDDILIGGYGADWISGGTGDDGILGDDGRIFVSRNSTSFGEPLYGIAAIAAADADKLFTASNLSINGVVNVTPTAFYSGLKYTVDLTPQNLQPNQPPPPDPLFRPLYANDIIYGGLGNDSIHGGAGDDAISGAEAPVLSFTNNYDQNGMNIASHVESDFFHPVNPGNPLGYNPATTKFDLYDANDPLRKILLTPSGTLSKTGSGDDWILNFNETEGPIDTKWIIGSTFPGVPTDGDDHIFGDLGNDWAVGGTGRDVLFGGWGDDVLNLDDNLNTNGGLNDALKKTPGTDTNPSYEDVAFGGAGRDVFLINTNGDRAMDWSGEFNMFFTPFAQYGSMSVSRFLQPALPDYLYALSKSDGADQTLAAQYGSDPTRNGEPFGELGLVTSKDAAWQDQKGASRDPQPGNTGGGPVDLSNGNATAGTKPIYETAADPAPATTSAAGSLTDSQLAPIVAEAKALWAQALGADPRLAVLDNVQVEVGNLPQDRLGVTIGGMILIDSSAAGRGWFVDPTLSASPASGRMDLLTTVMHELGNALGFREVGTPGNVMAETLALGVRGLDFDSLTARTEAEPQAATGSTNGVTHGEDFRDFTVINGDPLQSVAGAARHSGGQSMVDWDAELGGLLSGLSPYGGGSEKTALKPLFPAFDALRSREDSADGEMSHATALLPSTGWEWRVEVGAAGATVTRSEGEQVL